MPHKDDIKVEVEVDKGAPGPSMAPPAPVPVPRALDDWSEVLKRSNS